MSTSLAPREVELPCGDERKGAFYVDINYVTKLCSAFDEMRSQCLSTLKKCEIGGDIYEQSCVHSLARVSQSASCILSDEPCNGDEGDLCIENSLHGVCRAGNDGKLECHEASDECPPGSECMLLEGDSERVGACTDQFHCVLKQKACDEKHTCFIE
jgi:hypothetical protein